MGCLDPDRIAELRKAFGMTKVFTGCKEAKLYDFVLTEDGYQLVEIDIT